MNASTIRGLAEIDANIAVYLDDLRNIRDGLNREDPAGRHVAIAVTALEDARLRLEEAIRPTL